MAHFGKSLVRYEFYRLGFRADVIEPLADDDIFEIVTPIDRFRMTKRQFYDDFANVTRTTSYRERGLYHYPVPPQRALRYLALTAI